MKVIVVDDSAATRNYYRMLLEVGYSQASAQTAAVILGNERPSTVVDWPLGSGLGTGLPTKVGGPSAYGAIYGSITYSSAGVAVAVKETPVIPIVPIVPIIPIVQDKPRQGLFGESELQIHEATTGMEGLKLCRTLAPDCILLDHKLRDMTGLEFLAQLGEGAPADSPAYAVVMLTGLATERVAVEALKAGAQDYLLKDRISAESLRLAVDKATGKVRLIRALKDERDRLAAMLAEKEVLLKEVHHRVKNNLQVIVSLLRLQTRGSRDRRLNEALLESQHRVESMALIHEQLYETTDLREVDLARHTAMLIGKLFNSYGIEARRIDCRVKIAPLPLAVDQAIPAGLIMNELISNALKHAFPGGRSGVLEVRGGCQEGRAFFEVCDDGVGIPPEIDLTRPRSLGLEIVNILARQLKGVITLNRAFSEERAGTTLRVSFPAT